MTATPNDPKNMKTLLSLATLACFAATHSAYSNTVAQWPTAGANARKYNLAANIPGYSGIFHEGPIGSSAFYDNVEQVDGANRAFASVSMSITLSPGSFTESSTVTKETTSGASAWSHNWNNGDNRWSIDIDIPTYITIDPTASFANGGSVRFDLYDPLTFNLYSYNSNVNGSTPTGTTLLLQPSLYYFTTSAGADSQLSTASASYSVTVSLAPTPEPSCTLLIFLGGALCAFRSNRNT